MFVIGVANVVEKGDSDVVRFDSEATCCAFDFSSQDQNFLSERQGSWCVGRRRTRDLPAEAMPKADATGTCEQRRRHATGGSNGGEIKNM